jgi:hypothetical protein
MNLITCLGHYIQEFCPVVKFSKTHSKAAAVLMTYVMSLKNFFILVKTDQTTGRNRQLTMGLLSFERKYFLPLADVIAVPLGAKRTIKINIKVH